MYEIANQIDSASHVVDAQVERFVSQYRTSIQKTASAILELANVVNTAKNELSKYKFLQFRKEIGAGDPTKNSYINKLCMIAKNKERFMQIQEQLPASYTTLYALAKLKSDQFSKVVKEGIISSQMTALSLAQCLKTNSVVVKAKMTSKPRKQCVRFNLDLENIDDRVALKVVSEIKGICEKSFIHFECEIDSINTHSTHIPQKEFNDVKLAA